jgi:hypothetical protein
MAHDQNDAVNEIADAAPASLFECRSFEPLFLNQRRGRTRQQAIAERSGLSCRTTHSNEATSRGGDRSGTRMRSRRFLSVPHRRSRPRLELASRAGSRMPSLAPLRNEKPSPRSMRFSIARFGGAACGMCSIDAPIIESVIRSRNDAWLNLVRPTRAASTHVNPRSYSRTASSRTCAPAAHCSKAVDSASLWLMPLRQGTKIIVVGATRAT